MFYQGWTSDHCTHITGPVSQSSAESEYNSEFTAGMYLAHLEMRNNELLNKVPDVVPEQATKIILNRKWALCISNNGKDTKQTIQISRRTHSVRNVEDCNMQNTLWCEVCLKLSDIGTKNIRKDKFNTRLR